MYSVLDRRKESSVSPDEGGVMATRRPNPLKQSLDALSASFTGALADVDTLNADLDSLSADIAALSSSITSMTTQLSGLSSSLTSLQNNAVLFDTQYGVATDSMGDFNASIQEATFSPP